MTGIGASLLFGVSLIVLQQDLTRYRAHIVRGNPSARWHSHRHIWADEVQNVSGRSAGLNSEDGRALVSAAVGDVADEVQDSDLPF